jgi:sigma-54 dependent transcriptional regulator, acetoin dehydrogenase operon transcriptional activator AcoR
MAAMPGPEATGQHLAENRVRFLTAEPVEPHQVRDAILASWWRSRRWNVAADHLDLSYVRDPDLDTPLTRSAGPVLHDLRERLDGQPISIILTDPAGVVLTRLKADEQLDRHLDSVHLAPGFSYAEEFVGTNGIGTALEGGRPMHVFGHEHYAENLEDLACAGVPVQHPISGKTVGVVDLTCWRKDAGPLLITLAKTTAEQIRQALLTDSGMRELELFQEYLRACRRTSGIVLALNNDVVMMNDHARQVLDPADQSALLGQAAEVLAARHRGSVEVTLPTGAMARMHCRPVHGESRPAGGVVHVKLLRPDNSPGPAEPVSAPVRMHLPGVVGSAPLWVRAGHEVDAVYETGEWLALGGEPGVGKLALIRAIHQRRSPAERFHLLDARPVDARHGAADEWQAEARRELLDGVGTLVIRHVDALDTVRLRVLADALQAARGAGRQHELRVVVTLDQGRRCEDLTELLRSFPSTIELPPLRHHIEDLHELVPFFLGKLGRHGRLTCSPEAMQLLLRTGWPGNTEQLWQALRRVVRHRRGGAIQPNDLPPECRTVSRRLLSPLESMERDAIVRSLITTEGNKLRAARALGMSRATIYRKIHEYGIVAPTA